MARDARLAGDTVAAESCLQHIEHYVRLLEAAKRAEVARGKEQTQRMRECQADLTREQDVRTQRLFEAGEAFGKAV